MIVYDRSRSALRVSFKYHPTLVDTIKSELPTFAREWDASSRCWLVAPLYLDKLVSILDAFGQFDGRMPAISNDPKKLQLNLRYLARAKRMGDSFAAYGWLGAADTGSWSAIFPEAVLQKWFGIGHSSAGQPSSAAGTLLSEENPYKVLGVTNSATPADLRSAFRRMSRQWHPDVCSEPDANQIFIHIKEAYDLLADDAKRQKYDAIIAMMGGVDITPKKQPGPVAGRVDPNFTADEYGFRAPLRTGNVTVMATNQISRVYIEEIISWDDIVDNQGRILVVSLVGRNIVERWA